MSQAPMLDGSYTLDHFEKWLAIMEDDSGTVFEIEAALLPPGSRPGDKLKLTSGVWLLAKKYVTYKRKDIELQKQVDQLTEQLVRKDTFIDKLKGIIAGLKSKIVELEQKLSSRNSIREQMERGQLKSENDSLRKENQKLRDVLAAHGIPFGRKHDRNIE